MKLKICNCKIRGIVEIYEIKKLSKKDYYYNVPDPYRQGKLLRRFKYCPLCGNKI